jgi:hypothetical protein
MEEEKISCPKCQSTQIVVREKGFSPVKGAVGGVALGALGVLVGFHGSKNIMLYCLNCGHDWKHVPLMDEGQRIINEVKKASSVVTPSPAVTAGGGGGDYMQLCKDLISLRHDEESLKDFKPYYRAPWYEYYVGLNIWISLTLAVVLKLFFGIPFKIFLSLSLFIIMPFLLYLSRIVKTQQEKNKLEKSIAWR